MTTKRPFGLRIWKGYRKRFTPELKEWLFKELEEHREAIREGMSFVEKLSELPSQQGDAWVAMEVGLCHDAPKVGDYSQIYWVFIDKPVELRLSIASFEDPTPDEQESWDVLIAGVST